MVEPGDPSGVRGDEQQLSLSVLTLVLLLSLWLASGSLILGALDGGPHPLRRVLVGVLLVALTAAALWWRRSLCAWLPARPWLVVPLAVIQIAAAGVDGLLPSGPYVTFATTSVALAVVVARPQIVWLTVLVLEAGYACAILIEQSPAQVVAGGHLSGVVGAMLGFPFVALLGLGVVWLFERFMVGVDEIVREFRDGAPALTPALTMALQAGPPALAQLPAPALAAALTPTERRVVEALASGRTPKELAARWGISITTVRTHIRHAKRKTRARTLSELAGMAARRDWPVRQDDDA